MEQLIAQEVDGVKHFVHGDHIGSSSVVTDSSGTVVENTSYSPFGSVLEGGEVSRYGYEGREFDSLLGDTDFDYRRYKDSWGIFLQPDNYVPNTFNPQHLNHYSFENNNPYKYVDKDGHFAFVPFLIAGVVGAAINTGMYFATHEETSALGALTYAGTGFLGGGFATVGLGAAVLAAVGGTVVETAVDGGELSIGELALTAGVSAATFKVGKHFLNVPGAKRIKHLSSWFTTKSGSEYITNTMAMGFTGEIAEFGSFFMANFGDCTMSETNRAVNNWVNNAVSERSSGHSMDAHKSYSSGISKSRARSYAKKFGYSEKSANRKLAKRAAYFARKRASKS